MVMQILKKSQDHDTTLYNLLYTILMSGYIFYSSWFMKKRRKRENIHKMLVGTCNGVIR